MTDEEKIVTDEEKVKEQENRQDEPYAQITLKAWPGENGFDILVSYSGYAVSLAKLITLFLDQESEVAKFAPLMHILSKFGFDPLTPEDVFKTMEAIESQLIEAFGKMGIEDATDVMEGFKNGLNSFKNDIVH
jgi:hypothetical protein